MKKTLYLCVMAITMILLSTQSKAQTITSHLFYDSCTGQQYYINVSGGITGTKLETSYGDGTIDTNTVYGGNAYAFHSYTAGGTYTVKFVLYNPSGTRTDSVSYSQAIYGCSYITGRLYEDKNSNCVFDAGDRSLILSCDIEVDSAGVAIDTISSGWGNFTYRAHSYSTTYTFKIAGLPTALILTCPSGGSLSATPSFGTTAAAGDFGFSCSTSSAFDVALNAITHTGRHSNNTAVMLTNNSCNVKSGTLTVNIDAHYTVSTISPSSGTISGHTVTWNYSNLSIDSAEFFSVYASTTPWLTPGTSITTSGYINHITGDGNIANDSFNVADTVTSSWDPNEKTVMPKGNIKSGDRLTYTLAFENTGNAPAQNIHILDTLSGNVDPSSIQVVTSTHPVSILKLKDPTTGNTILKFDFANINLLDSSHHNKADGFVVFSIASKNGLANGTNINNKAGIYFDDNDVVMTNTVTNGIHTTGIAGVSNISAVSVYPNPVHNDLVIKTDNSYDNLRIINATGQQVMQQPLTAAQTHINVQALTPGIYFIILKGNNGVKVEKMEKL
ncbi:MAG: T9SS type A sorting domain-containing protein [Taibaiella sp.]|nr:T9SS type A sorting domain-containing protein [Taibaiella sp.]